MKRLAFVIGVVVLLTVVLVLWLNGTPDVGSVSPPKDDGGSRDVPFVHSAVDEGGLGDAGVVSGTVVDLEGLPVVGARVRLFGGQPELESLECGFCHRNVLSCEDPATVRQVVQGIDRGTFHAPAVLAETVTDADGAFVFPELPLGGEVLATSGLQGASGQAGLEPLALVLEEPLEEDVLVVNEKGEPMPDARVRLYSLLEGTVIDVPLDAQGAALVRTVDPSAWLFAERVGALAVGRRVSGGGAEFVLAAPRTLLVKALSGGKPIDVGVGLYVHGEDQSFPTDGGQLRLEGLAFGEYTVTVIAEDFAAPAQTVELNESITELVFELRRSARLVVEVTTPSGDLPESLSGTLTGQDAPSTVETETGSLEFDAVPEGEYSLRLESPGYVAITREVDLVPGQTTLQITLRPVLKVQGQVLGPDRQPVEGARVSATEEGEEISMTLSGEDGSFELELNFPGAIELHAEEVRHGVGALKLTVPAADVTVVLAARAVLEVEVVDFDGTSLGGEAMVRSERDGSIHWADDAAPIGRLAGLPGGWYVVERTVPERMPLSQRVEVVEGRVIRVRLKASEGAQLSGRVVDHLGRSVADATVSLLESSETASTDAAGRFTLKGVVPGAVELTAMDEKGAESPAVKATAPAQELVLTIPEAARVSGRVVDASGSPVRSFLVNDEPTTSDDGRFVVSAPQKTLDVSAEGYTGVFLGDVRGDVGDLVLNQEPLVEGDVSDADGRPVSGATVMASNDSMPVATDAQGRFRLRVVSEGAQDLVATRGAMAGQTALKVGTRHHLVLQRGGTVVGRVVNLAGKPVPTVVTITGRFTSRPIELETDEQGRFQVELGPAVWLFSTRSNRVQRAVEVRGARVEVTLGEEAGACGLAVHAAGPVDGLWLLSGPVNAGDVPWESLGRNPGSLEVPISQPSTEVAARGLPCGRYTLVASLDGQLVTQPLDLRRPAQPLELAAPPSEEPVP